MAAWLEVEPPSPLPPPETAAVQLPDGSQADEIVIGLDLQPIRRPATADRNPAGRLATLPAVCQRAVADREASVKKRR